jgi:hypothetical protein
MIESIARGPLIVGCWSVGGQRKWTSEPLWRTKAGGRDPLRIREDQSNLTYLDVNRGFEAETWTGFTKAHIQTKIFMNRNSDDSEHAVSLKVIEDI